MTYQTELFAPAYKYHKDNPQVFREFERLTFQTIEKGFKHYSAKGILELIRWHTGVRAKDQFKVNNNATAFYARLFEQINPQYKGFFRQRISKFD